MTRVPVLGLALFVLCGCHLSLAGKHACRSDKDCLNGRVCEEQRCVNHSHEDEDGGPVESEDGDAGVEEEPDAEEPIDPVACETNEECSAAQVCDLEQHRCAGCSVNADCSAGRICDRELARCVACTDHAQCNDGSVDQVRACHADACTRVECLVDGDCASGACDLEFKTCRQCQRDSDCGGSKVCETNTHRCIACRVDSDCGSGRCSGDNECIAKSPCQFWDTFPPSTQLGHLVSRGNGFTLADNYQVYVRRDWKWTLFRAAPTTPDAPVITNLVASPEFVAAVLKDGTILRGAQPPMTAIGRFDQISSLTAIDHRLWVATTDGKLRMHDGMGWSDLPSAPEAVVGVGESAQGLAVFTYGQGYSFDGASYRPFAVPVGSFQEVITRAPGAAPGAVFVRASDRLYRLSGTQLALDQPSPCARVAAVFNGLYLVARCQDIDAYYRREDDGTWKSIAPSSVVQEQGSYDGVEEFMGAPIPRTPSGLPTTVAALGGRQGSGVLIGGPRGVFRRGPDGFSTVPGTSSLDVSALKERPDGAVLSAVSSWSRLKACKQISDCGPDGQGYECNGGFCTWGSNWGDCTSTRSCEPGLRCFADPYPHCARSLEIHETMSGSDKTLFVAEGGFDPSLPGIALYGGDDPGQLLYFTTGSQRFLYRDVQGWHVDMVESCMNQTGIATFYAQFAHPDTLVTACIGRGIANVPLNGVYEQVADVTTFISSGPSWLVPLGDPPSVLLWWSGGRARLRTASGYLPFVLPPEAAQRAVSGNLRFIGGTPDKLVAWEPHGTFSEFGYQTATGWKTLTVPIPDLDLEQDGFWSTDGWASVYARTHKGALLYCPLD